MESAGSRPINRFWEVFIQRWQYRDYFSPRVSSRWLWTSDNLGCSRWIYDILCHPKHKGILLRVLLGHIHVLIGSRKLDWLNLDPGDLGAKFLPYHGRNHDDCVGGFHAYQKAKKLWRGNGYYHWYKIFHRRRKGDISAGHDERFEAHGQQENDATQPLAHLDRCFNRVLERYPDANYGVSAGRFWFGWGA